MAITNASQENSMTKSEQIESGKILYNECGAYARYMVEWRHKLMVRFFVSNTSLLVIVKWMWETCNSKMHSLIFLPFLIGAVVSAAFWVMDRRSKKVLKVCRDTGRDLEKTVFNKAGLYVNMEHPIELTGRHDSYSTMLLIEYIGFAGIMLIGAILSFIKYEGWKIFCYI